MTAAPVDLHYELAGESGETLLLLGSLGSSLAMWDPQVAALSRRFRLVRVDHRGHGESPVPPGPYSIDDLVADVVLLLDRLGIARCHVAGLSLGGMVAMRLAARHPERILRMVVLCTAVRLPPALGWLDRAALVRAGGSGVVAEAVVERWITPEERRRDPELAARLERMVAATPTEGYAACCEAIAEMNLTLNLPDIEAPLLAIAGAQDPATPPARLEAIATRVRDGRLLVIEDAAHLANLEQAAAVNAAILAHLGG